MSIFFLLISLSFSAWGGFELLSKDMEYVFPSGSKTTLSQGWFYDKDHGCLETPEKDLKVWFIEAKLEKNIEKLSRHLWRKVGRNFSYKVLLKMSPPPKNGWDQYHQIIYDVPSKENKLLLTIIRVLEGQVYVNLVEGAPAALEKRGAQFEIAAEGWKPTGLKKEDLSRNKVVAFTQSQEKELIKFIEKLMQSYQVPGVSMALIQDGRVVFKKAFGVKRAGSKDLVTDETPFMIGSITKPLTTLMLSKLVEQKKISWETPVNEILPDFSLADAEVSKKLQLKHTACACTGMPRRDFEFIFESEGLRGEDTIKQMKSFRPTTGFGETFQYSNHLVALGGFTGGAVHSKTGDLFQRYEKAMQELIFMPLQMNHSHVRPSYRDWDKLSHPHTINFYGKVTPMPIEVDNIVYSVAPAGSVWSTPTDMAKYLMIEMGEGRDQNGKEIFQKETILSRRVPQIKAHSTSSYGLGLVINQDRGLEIVGHNGGTLGFASDLWFVPKDRFGMVILTNTAGASRFGSLVRQKVLELFYGAKVMSPDQVAYSLKRISDQSKIIQKRVDLKNVKWLEKFIGRYKNTDLGAIEILRKNQKFIFDAGEWQSELGSVTESNGDKLMSLMSVPWSGSLELQVKSLTPRTLLFDDGQQKYEFTEIK